MPGHGTNGRMRRGRCALFASALGWLIVAAPLLAQDTTGRLEGRVQQARAPFGPIVRALVFVLDHAVRTETDSGGHFSLLPLPAGPQVVVIRVPGYLPDTLRVTIRAGQILRQNIALRAAVTTLADVRVEAEAVSLASRLSGFDERRRAGIGHFLDRAAIAKRDAGRLSELLRTVPGVRVQNGGARAWVSSGRAVATGAGAFARVRRRDVLDPVDDAAGAPLACFLDVYVDGTIVYNSSGFAGAGRGTGGTPLFDVNSIQPSSIEAIEVYSSTAQVPAAYNKTGGGCGVMLIWTRVH